MYILRNTSATVKKSQPLGTNGWLPGFLQLDGMSESLFAMIFSQGRMESRIMTAT